MEEGHPLQSLLRKIADEQNFTAATIDVTPTTSDGANYTSKLYLATISQEGRQELKLFAKVANVGEKMRAMAPFRIFDTEIFFYTKLIKTYRELEDNHDVPAENRLVTARFYGYDDTYLQETLVWEDLTAKGFQMFDRFKSFDWAYASESVTQLARLHALSIAYSIERPDDFLKDAQSVKMQDRSDQMNGFVETAIAKVLTVVKEERKEKLRTFIKEMAEENNFRGLMSPLRRGVFSHSDFRPSNLMHRYNKDGSVQVIPIDYQTVQHGNPITDLLYFVFTGSDGAFRRQHYRPLLSHYHAQLSAALRALHLDPATVYPESHFELDLREVLPYGLLVSCMLLTMVTVDAENAPVLTEDSDVMDFLMAPSELCKMRLAEIVDDFTEMGVI
ncbi:unnamed protein product [Leptidea sinapis]|uniref:CHK kinase-like domain-containing protein n=1 Tax=Leptidea sinapis TaxID=189913 RepID=A0A5E4QJW5_9NEOP|nr:unnamed protein product [Leptidea sinapis]